MSQQANVCGSNRCGQRTSCFQIRQENRFFRREQLCGFSHKVDAAKHNHVRIGLRSLACECQGIAGDVGDAMKDFRRLVIVGEDDGVAFCF